MSFLEWSPLRGAALVAVLAATGWLSGQQLPVQKLMPSLPTPNADFGTRVAADQDTIVASAMNLGSGVAFVFHRVAGVWSEQAILSTSDASSVDFGHSVALAGDTLVVGSISATGLTTSSGSAYVFERDGSGDWTEIQEIFALDGTVSDNFGFGMSLYGEERLVVSAPFAESPITGIPTGAVYVFEKQGGTWNQVLRIDPLSTVPPSVSFFGIVVLAHEEHILIRSFGPSAGIPLVHVYALDGTGSWAWSQTITGSVGTNLGAAMAMADGEILLSSPGHSEPGASLTGALEVYSYSGQWNLADQLVNPSLEPVASFGYPVSAGADFVVIGAPGTDLPAAASAGAGHLLRRGPSGALVLHSTLVDSTPGTDEGLGAQVAWAGDQPVLGIPWDSDAGPGHGAIAVYGSVRPPFRRGDCDLDGTVNIADAIVDLASLFTAVATPPACPSACDSNDDGARNIADPITTLAYLFVSAPPPPAPGPTQCGVDGTPDTLDCGGPPCN